MAETDVKRIEIALARIEAAALASRANAKDDVTMLELRARHDALRTQTQAAIAEIDALIGKAV